jgi:serine acetyltransferase
MKSVRNIDLFSYDKMRFGYNKINSIFFPSKSLKYLYLLRNANNAHNKLSEYYYRFRLKKLQIKTDIQIPFGTKIGGVLSWLWT